MTFNLSLNGFYASDGLFLPSLLYEPKIKTDCALIYLHGNGSSSVFYKTDFMNNFAKKCTKNNMAFFTFNNRGANIIKSLKKKMNELNEEKIMYGMVYELIEECVFDIDGAIDFLKEKNYKNFFIAGHSTGANKIVVYDFLKKYNEIIGYILLAGGDDMGLYYDEVGKKIFFKALEKSKLEIENGNGRNISPKYISKFGLSYQSLFDTINPEGLYNIFPYYDIWHNLKLSNKKPFLECQNISKPTFVLYGDIDEFCFGNVRRCLQIFQSNVNNPNFSYDLIEGANHGFYPYEETMMEKVVNYIKSL